MEYDSNAHLWTFEAAYFALTDSANLSKHTLDCLSRFFDLYSGQIQKCYDPVQKRNDTSQKKFDISSTKLRNGVEVGSLDPKVKKDAEEFSKALDIDQMEALHVVYWFARKGILNDEKRQLHYARHYLSERRYLIKIVIELFLDRVSSKNTGTTDPVLIKLDKITRQYSTDILANEAFFSDLIKHTATYFKEPVKDMDDDQLLSLVVKESSIYHLQLLDLIFQSVTTVIPVTSDALLNWTDLIIDTGFFQIDPSIPQTASWKRSVQTLCNLITISFLDLQQDFSIDGAADASYIKSPEKLNKVNTALFSALEIEDYSPVVITWGAVLHRISLRLLEVPDSSFDKFLTECGIDAKNDNKYENMSQHAGNIMAKALDMGAVNHLARMLKTLPQRLEYATVCCDVLQAMLPYITMNDSVASAIESVLSTVPGLGDTFFADAFAEKALVLCRAKVPIAITPFLKLAQSLGHGAFEYLYDMKTYMQELPRTFRDYDFILDKPNIVQLTSPLVLFEPREDGSGGIILPPGSTGEIIPSGGTQTVVLWNLEYNGWSFLGRILEQALAISLTSSSDADALPLEIIKLINNTLPQLSESRAIELLNACSDGLGQMDIVEMVTKILDDALYSRDLEMCIAGIDFLRVLTEFQPHRVWPYVGRSKLLERNGRGGLVATILGAVEIVNNKYDFTIAIIKFVNALVRDATRRALDGTVSQKVKRDVLQKFTEHLVNVYESFAYWRYTVTVQRIEIASLILETFTEIIFSSYRVAAPKSHQATSDIENDETKVTAVLNDAARTITGQFLSGNDMSLRTLQPLLGAIESAARAPEALDSDNCLNEDELSYAEATLKFCSLMLRVRSLLRLPLSVLDKKLFAHSPDLALVFTRYHALHASVVDVLESMISGYCPEDQPSLLAHLGTVYSQMLITGMAGAIQNDLESDVTVGNICTYFSAILDSQQEGMSILLISGKDTRNTSNKVESVVSLLTILEEKITAKGNEIPPVLADQILDAIAPAHSNWNMNKRPSPKDADKTQFTQALIDIIDTAYKSCSPSAKQSLQRLRSDGSHNHIIKAGHINAMAAKAIRILSIELYKDSQSAGSKQFLEMLKKETNLLDYSKAFLAVGGFRPSLHGNLQRNFDSKWPNGRLPKFMKSNLLTKKIYGISYVYDLWLLDSVLAYDAAWHNGYRFEVIEANVNLSYVDSQINLIKAWCLFVTSLVLYGSKDKKVLELSHEVATLAIEYNLEDDLSIPIFQEICSYRVDLSFFIMYHLSKTGVDKSEIADMEKVFSLLADNNIGFLTSALSSNPEDPKIYRPLLKILNLYLDEFTRNNKTDTQLLQDVHGILDVVVIKGMKTVVAAARNNPAIGAVEDMIQITMILRKCLNVNGVSSLYPNLAMLMADSGCDRDAMSLFSLAHELKVTGPEYQHFDPTVYDELTLLYLLEWLKVDAMADHFVMNGLLSVLIESPISKLIQHGRIVATTEPRLHSIWSKGIITIVLELLRQLGTRIVPEVIVFLNFFESQIDSTLKSWVEGVPAITLSLINETWEIILLYDIVHKLCEADQVPQIPKIINNSDLVEALEYLLSHQKYLASRVAVSTPEEQKLDAEDALMSRVIDELNDLREFLDSE
ncbi:nucleoporin Nup188p [Trichomonascus vanleenenianus]|uniref:Nup188p n=1 Tax=Trichomonascus vanleenenianus TaxID=2268995 RepID=UPI003ECA7EB9